MCKQVTAVLTAVLVAAACTQEPTGVSSSELALAQDAQLIAQEVAASSRASHEGWLQRLRDTLRTTDDPEARAFVEQAAAYRDLALTAREAGDFELARHYWRLSFRSILAAVIEIFPNAPARTGAAVDEAIARIELRLGDREAPRIRRIITHVRELRNQADRALAAGDPVTALALNVRGMQILYWLVQHIREAHADHDAVADAEMQGA